MSLTNLKAITVVVAAIAALIAVRWVYFKILCIAKDKNLVDNPDARKLQKQPIPVMGGIAVFNMIDGVNGLSSTLCLLSSGLYGIVFLKSGDVANATLAFSMAAALVPFIRRGTIRVIQRDSKGIPTIVTLS